MKNIPNKYKSLFVMENNGNGLSESEFCAKLNEVNTFITEVNNLSFQTFKEELLSEDDSSSERDEVLRMIQNNEFEVNNHQRFLDSAFKGKRKEYLTPYALEQFKEMKTFQVTGYDIGYAIKPDGDIVSVFNNSNIKGIGVDLVKSGLKNGGTKLDHYDGYLSTLYEPLGFKEVDRYKWDDQYAPKDWDYDRDGRPDVIMRELQ